MAARTTIDTKAPAVTEDWKTLSTRVRLFSIERFSGVVVCTLQCLQGPVNPKPLLHEHKMNEGSDFGDLLPSSG
jgi:hypothetical protein